MPVSTKLQIAQLERVAHILKAISHPVRIQIIDLLRQEEKLSVTEIYESLKVEQSLTSHHLSKMKDKGILTSERDGKSIIYSLTDKRITNIIDCIEKCNM